MNSIYLGIDVGGTHTDGVALDITAQRIVHKVKTATTPDLKVCSLSALDALMDVIAPADVARVVLSTTLVTNAVANGRLEPAGLLVTAGPGMNPAFLLQGPHSHLVRGAMDHRGREIAPLDEDEVRRVLDSLRMRGVEVLAVAGKFAVRNPAHELRIAELAEPFFEHVCLAHRLSGALNFPRRVVTAHLAAGVWRLHANFVATMAAAVESHGIKAPLYLLRADGGAQLAATFKNPAETALSGPAASIMGSEAMDPMAEETLTLDVGGTTTDIALFVKGSPLLEPQGATIGEHKTQIRALFNRSIAAGGDSVVTAREGRIAVGPDRHGPAAAFGGPSPTPTDAMVILGRTAADRDRAAAALTPVAETLGLSLEATAVKTIEALARKVAEAARAFVVECGSRPVYTIREMLAGHEVRPTRAVMVGGPARALAPYVERELGIPVSVASQADVANAVGAAVSRVNLEVNAVADTAHGYLSIPEAGIHRQVPSSYSRDELLAEAKKAVATLAEEKGIAHVAYETDVAEEESFRIVEGFAAKGSVHRLKLQIRPSILFKVE